MPPDSLGLTTTVRTKAEVLREVFGYRSFRGGQEPLVDAVLAGRDVLAVMPTGAGKSLCFQVPALMGEGITLVVSPLISLMKDQVGALIQNGVRAAYINSSLTPTQIDRALSNARRGMYKLIYVAPERLLTDAFLSFACSVEISLLAVDEAHCVSQWGQDFRPGYLDIAEFAARLPRRPVIGAYTATATAAVREDVIRLLCLRDPLVVSTGFDRPNLRFEVVRAPGKEKDTQLLRLLGELQGQSGIVYCATRKAVEEVCGLLCGQGIPATRYHAGLGEEERFANQDSFLYDRTPVMVATNAFGMGIDKSNVSFVIHYHMPKDMESYYQEAGRAGRDGSAARCILLYAPADVRLAKYLIEHSEPNEDISPGTRAILRERELERLKQMTFYATTADCLRGFILRYFGERGEEQCGNCSNCLGGEVCDVTRETGLILRCVAQSGERWGVGMTVNLLRGSGDERLAHYDSADLPMLGAMREVPTARIRELIDLLLAAGFLRRTEGEYPLLQLGPRADEVLCGSRRVTARLRTPGADAKKAQKRSALPSMTESGPPDEALYEKLRRLRTKLADRVGIPAYAVFTNATLLELSVRKPGTRDELMSVSGIGRSKCDRWGKAILDEISRHTGTKAR